MSRASDILALIDGVLPEQEDQALAEISGLLVPQYEFILAMKGVELPTNHHREFDTHHLFWPRSAYVTRLERQFRQQFVVPIGRGVHEELHATVEAPAMPGRAVMLGYLALIQHKDASA